MIEFQYEAKFDDNLKHVLEKKRYEGRNETISVSIVKQLEEAGQPIDYSAGVTFKAPFDKIDAPGVPRKIADIALVIKLKGTQRLTGPAGLDISYDNGATVHVSTDERGVLATSTVRPAGSGLGALEALVRGKKVDGTWEILTFGASTQL